MTSDTNACKCWPLATHYFFYFTLLGAILPYLGLYLSSLEFSPAQIGELMAAFLLTKIVAPNIWGALADRNQRPVFWVRLAIFLALVLSTGLIVFDQYWSLFSLLLAFSFFWHAALPQFESFTFKSLGMQKHKYGQLRLWGSVGFIASVMVLGALFDVVAISVLPWILTGLLLILWLTTWLFKDLTIKAETQSNSEGFRKILYRPEVMALLWVSFLVQLSHGVYYSFFTIQMTALGWSSTAIAWLWSLGVVAEIAVFWWMARLFQRFTVRNLILVAICLTFIRWLITGYADDSLVALLFAQTLHAASFGLFHAAAIHLIDQYFYGRHHGKGQALFAASSHGLGGSVGMLTAGYTWQVGAAPLSYTVMAASALLAGLIAYRWIR